MTDNAYKDVCMGRWYIHTYIVDSAQMIASDKLGDKWQIDDRW